MVSRPQTKTDSTIMFDGTNGEFLERFCRGAAMQRGQTLVIKLQGNQFELLPDDWMIRDDDGMWSMMETAEYKKYIFKKRKRARQDASNK